LIIFFVCPKKTIQKPRRDAYGERALFRRCLIKVFGKPQSTAIKSELISNPSLLSRAFNGYTDEKEEDISYCSDGMHFVEHHLF
jgi:hypothetical protein